MLPRLAWILKQLPVHTPKPTVLAPGRLSLFRFSTSSTMSARPKRAPKRSRKYDEEELEDEQLSEEAVPVDAVSEEEEEEKPKKKRAPPRPKKQVTAFTDESGWSFEPPSLLYKDYKNPKPSTKIAGIDLDGTMVNTKSGAQFPRDDKDFKWFNKHVKDKIRSYHQAGYKIVVFTNQGSIKSAITGKAADKVKGRIDAVMDELDVPAQVFAATMTDEQDSNRKPKTGMWDFFCAKRNGGVVPDKSCCFYVGDAAGRPTDFADSDKSFSEAVDIEFRLPDDEFGEMEGKRAMPTGGAKKAKGEEGGSQAVANPDNSGLVSTFSQLADKFFEDAKMDGKAKFKAISTKKVLGVLAAYPIKVTLNNLKEVGKLQGVGKGSLAKIQEYLQTGTVSELSGVDDLAGVGKAAPQIKDTGKDIANKFM